MNITSKISGYALAASAAALFLAAPIAYAGDTASTTGHCAGVNACKGHGSCKSASNSCKGQNSCKGTGFVAMTKDQCDQVGGKFTAK